MKGFKDKVAVITGGASGVGRSLAFNLGKRGAKIIVCDVDEKAMAQTLDDLKGESIEAITLHCDVSSREACDAVAKQAFEAFGGVHLLFANAGVGAGEAGPIWEYSDNDWKWAFGVNFWGVVNTVAAFMPHLIKQNEEARVIITGSLNGAFVMYPDQPIYTATKAAVQAYTENLHFQLQGSKSPIKVSALFPGPHTVVTGIFDSDRIRPEGMAREEGKPDSGITSVDDMQQMMKDYGLPPLPTTHPDEVAEAAVKGIENDDFWIMPLSDMAEKGLQKRFEGVMKRKTPRSPTLM